MCAEASTVLRAVAADFFCNCWCVEIPSDNRILHLPRCVHYHAQGFRSETFQNFYVRIILVVLLSAKFGTVISTEILPITDAVSLLCHNEPKINFVSDSHAKDTTPSGKLVILRLKVGTFVAMTTRPQTRALVQPH
jgi:hypothetical protein